MKLCTELTFSLIPLLIISTALRCSGNLLRKPEEVSDNFEGDILINEDEEEALESGQAGAGQIGDHYRWKNATVPYVFDSAFTQDEKAKLLRGMAEISSKTCIIFKPRTEEKDYIKIIPGRGCSSYVGRQGNGAQTIKLSRTGCFHHGTIMHEMIHALGFWHEQSRTDRDDYVKIVLDNVESDHRHNFAKYTSKRINDYGVPYDFGSVMHYPENAFVSNKAVLAGKKTIIPRKQGARVGQRSHLSALDALKINRMYCPERAELTTTTTPESTTTVSTTTAPESTTTVSTTTTPESTTIAVETTTPITSTSTTTKKPSFRARTRSRLNKWRRLNLFNAERDNAEDGNIQGDSYPQPYPSRYPSQFPTFSEYPIRELASDTDNYQYFTRLSQPRRWYPSNSYFFPRQELSETRVKRMDLYVMK